MRDGVPMGADERTADPGWESGNPTNEPVVYSGAWPCFEDPATKGVLLEQVRERWGRLGLTTKCHPLLGWIVVDGHDDFLKSVAEDSEAEALVCALEAVER
jgi:hypothetical protein